jgi:HEAT repeat protein
MKPAQTNILLLLMLILFLDCCTSQPSLESLLTHLASYQEGQSRQYLSQIEALVQQALKSPRATHQIEVQMAAFLASDASLAGKQFICRQLEHIGSDYSVPVLAGMLADSSTAEMARYALEGIPGQAVNDALRDAIPRVTGKIKVGVITTLGLRRDSASVELLGQILLEARPDPAAAACAALGEIASDRALQILQDASRQHTGELQVAIYHALLSGANTLQIRGRMQPARTLYQEIYTGSSNAALRAGSLRGILLSDPEHAGEMVLKILKNKDSAAQAVAVQTLNELPGINNLVDIAETLPELEATIQIQLLAALAATGQPAVQAAIINLLQNKNPRVRLAAIKALVKTGDNTTIAPMVQTAVAATTEDERNAARESLYALQGEQVNNTILSQLADADPAEKVELIRAIQERHMLSARERILSFTEDNNPQIRIAAIKCLGTIAAPELLPLFLDKLSSEATPEASTAWEQSIVDVARMIPESAQPAKALLEKYARLTEVAEKGRLLKLLGRLRDPFSLFLIAEELKNENLDLQYAAIQALNSWQARTFDNDAIMAELLSIAQKPGEGKHQILALRGFLHLAGIVARNSYQQGLKYYLSARPYTVQANEKRLLLSGLQTINSLDALQLAAQYLSDPDVKSEAETTILKLASELITEHPVEVKTQLQHIINTSEDEQHINEAKGLLSQ